jgi:translocation and assembly module TamA
MRPERIVEIAGLPEGVTFSPAVLDRVTERLRDTGVFSAVALGEQPLGPGDTMDIVATLTESPPRRFGFGAELSTDEGARVSAFWLHRNLFGGAERLRIEGEIRGIGEGELSVDEGSMASMRGCARAFRDRPPSRPIRWPMARSTSPPSMSRPSSLVGSASRPGSSTGSRPSWRARWVSGFVTFRFEDARGDRESATLFYDLPAELTWDNRDDDPEPDHRRLHDRHGVAVS